MKAALSDEGFETASRIMSLENNLLEGEKNSTNGTLRDPQRYFLTIFGMPEKTGSWGWSLEGHHLSMNFAVRDGQVIGDTPSFWGACPANVKIFVAGGPAVGTRTLAEEEQLAFDLVNSLDESHRQQAVIAEKAPAEYRAAGKPEPPQTAPEGLPASDMTAEQRQILAALLKAYSSNLAPELLAARMAEVEKQGIENFYFAWAGATTPGVGHYYRIQGPSVLLELVNVQKDPAGNPANHIHSVWRNPQGDFGKAEK